MKIVIVSLLSLICFSAHAGVGAHGGNAVMCPAKETVTIDYYDASLPTVGGPADIVDLAAWTQDQVVDFIRSRFNGSPFQDVFDRAVLKFGSMDRWPLADLKAIDDGGEPYFLPKDCRRVTAAARQDNTIYVDPAVITLLSPAQRGMLYVHEMLYWISRKDSSAPVREALRILLLKNPTPSAIAEAVHLIGLYYTSEYINSQNYRELKADNSAAATLAESFVLTGSWSNPNNVNMRLDIKGPRFYTPAGNGTYGGNYDSFKVDCSAKMYCEVLLEFRDKSTDLCRLTKPTLNTVVLECNSSPDRYQFIDFQF